MRLKTIFEKGEAEALVKKIRQLLREADEHRQQNRHYEAGLADETVHDLTQHVLERLASRFNHYALTGLSGRADDTKREAIELMFHLVWIGMWDLSESKSAKYFETTFNRIVQLRILDALRSVKRNEEFDDKNRALSLDAALQSNDGEMTETLGDVYEDIHAAAAFEKVLNQEIAARFLDQLPTDRHRKVFFSRLAGDTWEVVAVKAGCCEKTARTYFEQMRSRLMTLLTEQR